MKRFDALTALGGVDFDMPRHGIVSVIGPNGAGKTVFFNVLSGITKPDAGEIWFDGHRITGLRPDLITQLGMARTFQNLRLFGNMTVLENVLVGEHSRLKVGILGSVLHSPQHTAEESESRRRAMDILRFVGIEHIANAVAGNLPYGMARRLEIARALAAEPQLLLLDEPTSGMNPQETNSLIDLIDSIHKDMAVAVLLIEHDMRVVMRISERISVLDYGLKIAEGTPGQVRSDQRVIEAYLGRGASAEREIAPEVPTAETPQNPSPKLVPRTAE
jgi:branched-chain amino acid transport system ATP-binding protein